jgi:Spy/CpxP family protein refolding chaperone
MSRWLGVFGLGVGAVLLAAFTAWAQADAPAGGRPRGGMGGGAMILRAPEVQKDLKLTDDQKEKIQALSRERLGREEMEKKLQEILKPEQLERLKQIRLQMAGPMALASPEVVKALELNDEQKGKIKTLLDQSREKAREAMQGARDLPADQRTAMWEKVQQQRKETAAKVMEVLTPQQREKFEKMQGAKIELNFPARGPRGGGQGR